jgi:hypothetical protein
MRPKQPAAEPQEDLFHAQWENLVGPRHPLVRLAGLIAWLLACLLSPLVVPNQTGNARKPHPPENRLFHGRPAQVQR